MQLHGVTSSQIRRATKANNKAQLQQLLKQTTVGGDLSSVAEIINCGNEHNKCALHIAAQWSDCSVVECLLNHKADINAVVSRGQLPICFAIGKKRCDTVQLLLRRGAKLLVRSVQGETPLSMARGYLGRQHPGIVEAIEAQEKVQVANKGNWIDLMYDERAILAQVTHTFNCRNCLDKIRLTLAAPTQPSDGSNSSYDPARPPCTMLPWISRFLDIHRAWHERGPPAPSTPAPTPAQPPSPYAQPLGLHPVMLANKDTPWWQPTHQSARGAVFRCVVGRVLADTQARLGSVAMKGQFMDLLAEVKAVLVDTGQASKGAGAWMICAVLFVRNFSLAAVHV